MPITLATFHLAGPGIEAEAVTEPRKLLYTTPSSNPAPRRVKVTAIVTLRDDTEVTTYKVEEVDDMSDAGDKSLPLPQLIDRHRIRSQSESTIFSDDIHLRTPPSPLRGLPLVEWPFTPSNAPRIPSPPSPKLESGTSSWSGSMSTRRGAGLGLDLTGCDLKEQSSIVYTQPGQWGAVGDGRKSAGTRSLATPLTSPSSLSYESSDEEPYYHLPSDLFSPELEMSTTEFKESVIRWTERRTKRKHATHSFLSPSLSLK